MAKTYTINKLYSNMEQRYSQLHWTSYLDVNSTNGLIGIKWVLHLLNKLQYIRLPEQLVKLNSKANDSKLSISFKL